MTTIIWAMLGAALIVAELFTFSFYLMIVGLAFFIGSLASYFEASFTVQLLLVAVASCLGCFGLYRYRSGKTTTPDLVASLDSGALIDVQSEPYDSGTRWVTTYRGCQWTVFPADGEPALTAAGSYRIASLRGPHLLVHTTEAPKGKSV